MKFPDLFQQIAKGKILPLYYFYGPEKWLITEAIQKIKEKILNPATSDFNFKIFDGETDSEDTLWEGLQVFPVQSSHRLVIIRNAEALWKDQTVLLGKYLEDPNPFTCAIFWGEKPDPRMPFIRILERKGAVFPFYPLSEKELSRWVVNQVEQMGGQITEEAVFMLLNLVGDSLQDLYSEIQKLSLSCRSKPIQIEDVQALAEDVRLSSPFELPRAVGHMDLPAILRGVKKNLQRGDSPLLLFSLILRQLRLIQKAKAMRATGLAKKEVEGKLKILPRFAGDFWKQVDEFPSSTAQAAFWAHALEADQGLKGGRLDKGLQLERFLLELYFQTRNPRRGH